MSGAIVRRNSSKEGLRNLLRVTAQRSMEDAEELERERRRRARESFRSTSSTTGGPSLDYGTAADDALYDEEIKPSSSPSLEEDEGFSDWTQRLERRRQQRMEELGQGAEEERSVNSTSKSLSASPVPANARLHKQKTEREGEQVGEMEKNRKQREREEEVVRRQSTQKDEEEKCVVQMRATKRTENIQAPEAEVKEKRLEKKVSYTSKVFLQQEPKNNMANNGNATLEDVTSRISVKTRKTPWSVVQAIEAEETEAILETEQRLEKIRRSHKVKESQELEHLRQRQVEAEQELEVLKMRREERRQVREEEERRREEEEHQRLAKEEEEKRRMKEDIERRRLEAAERIRNLSTSSVDGEEMFSPLSPKGPTHKRENEEGLTADNAYSITERTESLNRSLKKSSSFKKTQPPVLLSRMDDRLEQYTQAIENSQEAKAGKQGLLDVLSPVEAVASKKNLFEAGEAWSLGPTKGTPIKDTEGLKVGVADLITQWVKGNPGSKQSPTKPNDVKPGEVMQKKNMWEVIGDSSGGPGKGTKGTSSIKRYKFVVTGHGKYEKMVVDHDNVDDYRNGQSDLCQEDY